MSKNEQSIHLLWCCGEFVDNFITRNLAEDLTFDAHQHEWFKVFLAQGWPQPGLDQLQFWEVSFTFNLRNCKRQQKLIDCIKLRVCYTVQIMLMQNFICTGETWEATLWRLLASGNIGLCSYFNFLPSYSFEFFWQWHSKFWKRMDKTLELHGQIIFIDSVSKEIAYFGHCSCWNSWCSELLESFWIEAREIFVQHLMV